MSRRGTHMLVLAFLLVGVGSACVSTNHVLIDPSAARYAAVPSDSVVIYEKETELDTFEYVRIALIDASSTNEFNDRVDMLKAMRREAGKLGANAILVSDIEEPPMLARIAADVLGAETERRGSVVAIRILGRKQAAGTD